MVRSRRSSFVVSFHLHNTQQQHTKGSCYYYYDYFIVYFETYLKWNFIYNRKKYFIIILLFACCLFFCFFFITKNKTINETRETKVCKRYDNNLIIGNKIQTNTNHSNKMLEMYHIFIVYRV